LNATAPQSDTVNLTWNAVAGATTYRVERKGPADADFVEIAASVAGTSYADTGRSPQTSYDYRVRAENAGGLSPYSAVANAVTPAAPTPTAYSTANIGSGANGTTTALPDGTSFDTVAGGSNIQGTADSFHFVYQSVTGDFDIKAQITGLSDTSGSPKAGLMARADLTANAANVYAHVASNGYRISRRATAGANTDMISANNMNAYPNTWVRLRRVGNTFTAFRSVDGVNWVTIGAYTQALPATLLVGMATTAQSLQQTTATYRNVG
jgi:regulation of enolase protein 1 (concanavalin A-like superfamily)